MARQRKQSSTTYPILFRMVLTSDHLAPATGKTVTATLSKNGAAFAAAAGAVTELSSGWYALAGNATDRATLGTLLLHATAASTDDVDLEYEIVSFDPFADITTARAANLDVLSAAIAELSQGVPSATPTIAQALSLLHAMARNAMTEDGSYLTISNDAGAVIAKSATSDVNGVTTRAKLVTGP